MQNNNSDSKKQTDAGSLKRRYVIQPFLVGSAERKSLVITIPKAIAQVYKITTSSILSLKPISGSNKMMLTNLFEVKS